MQSYAIISNKHNNLSSPGRAQLGSHLRGRQSLGCPRSHAEGGGAGDRHLERVRTLLLLLF